ncbi:hypothetical protein HPB50_003674 [Hyalomma asiaticum]|uniref:Uncharacterized protein n=1 Tax=Hyalomma asiaticum TaxID=266040 RepID=A0ACB7SUS0_HYAAI|nr:hypothetical protein HPB50_003674 [Hyalomma asiaticum]
MKAPAAQNRKISTAQVPQRWDPFAKGPLGGGQAAGPSRYGQGTRARGVGPAGNVQRAVQAGSPKNGWKGAAIAVNDDTTTTVPTAPGAKRGANSDNRPIQQTPRDKRRGWGLFVLPLAGVTVLVLVATAYYLAHGHASGPQGQPELLEVSRTSPASWNSATSTLDEGSVLANASTPREEADDEAPPPSTASPPAVLKKKPKKRRRTTMRPLAETSSTARSEGSDDEEDDPSQQSTDGVRVT